MDSILALKVNRSSREIMEHIISLPLDEQEKIACNIFYNVRNETIKAGKFTKRIEREVPQEKFDSYLRCAGEVVGCEINLKCKRRDMTLGRVFVIAQLYREGYSIPKIAEKVHKQRDVVLYNINKYEDMLRLPKLFAGELDKWGEFQKKITAVRR